MIWKVISNLFIIPLRYIIELIFSVLSRITGNYGLSIICVSVVVQVLVLPLYKSADAVQEKERNKQKSMEKWVNHIKKTFSGNERFMMLSAYYNEQNYKPYYSLKSSVSLLLQIPFFIAAYNFLSTLQCLGGVSFLFLRDLLKPDALFSIGGFSVNVMPILMTVINIASGMIYTRGFPIKEKIQLFGMAAIFLVLLYNSPSGLVLYWTMNNLFSLLKNVFMKLVKDPKRVIRYILVVVGFGITVLTLRQSGFSTSKKLLCFGFALVCFIPQLVFITKRFIDQSEKQSEEVQENMGWFFFICAIIVSLIMGFVIPVSVVSSSPEEFIRPSYGPMRLIFDVFTVSLGFFLVWGGIFFALTPPRLKKTFVYAYLVIIGFSLVDFFIFGKNAGLISSELVFDNDQTHSYAQILLSFLGSVLCSTALIAAYKLFRVAFKKVLIIILLSLLVLSSVWSVRVIRVAYPLETKKTYTSDDKVFSLSTKGRNVIVLMLDRAMGSYLPYVVNERQDVAQALAEFTYYPNTLSFGKHTNFASAALFGGYEYTPEEINKRTDMTLVEKQNEALTVMPLLFSENGYEVTVCDPPYAGYQWIPDISIYDSYPEIKAYNLTGRYAFEKTDKNQMENDHTRRLFFYSLMKCSPLLLSNTIYDYGYYFSVENLSYSFEFKNSVAALQWLPLVTETKDDSSDCFVMMQNDTPHQPNILIYPGYELFSDGDQYEADPGIRVASDGSVLDLSDKLDRAHYHSFALSMILLSRWIDFMKENDVWDNTRMIIVSDHGIAKIDSPRPVDNMEVVGAFNPVLLVKDFSDGNRQKEMKTNYSFMTNADVPTLSVSGIIPNAVNPFTGKQINSMDKKTHQQMVTTSGLFDADGKNAKKTQFDTSDGHWYAVSDNIFDLNNWHLVE